MFVDDLSERLANRIQLTSDGHKSYLVAVEEAFGHGIDYAMLVKIYGGETGGGGAERRYSPDKCIGIKSEVKIGNPDPKHIRHVIR